MNITCDSCQARYTISDEKVTGEGRVFQVRCKQCDAEIVVDGISEEASADSHASSAQPEELWYYALGQDRQGPVSREELGNLITAGTVSRNTYVWCEGMEDWSLVEQIERLAYLMESETASASEPQEAANPALLDSSVEASSTEPSSDPAPQAEAQSASEDDLFSFDESTKAPRGSVHGRRDSSVLFSLDELSSFEEPKTQDPQSFLTETSGLIDIRGLANSHQAKADDADNPFLSATGGASSSRPSFSLSYVPVVARKRSPLPWIIGAVVLVVVGVGVTLALVGGGDADEKSGTDVSAPEEAAAASSTELPSKPQPAPQAKLATTLTPSQAPDPKPPIEETAVGAEKGSEETAKAVDPKAKPTKPAGSVPKVTPRPVVASTKKTVRQPVRKPTTRVPAKPAVKPAQPKSAPVRTQPKPPARDSKASSKGVNDLLSSLSGKKKVKTETGSGGGSGPKTLTSSTVRSKVGARKSRFKSCYKMQPNRGATGVNLTLKFTIKNTGAVGSARVSGGGLTGSVQSCILRALKSIRFPVFRNPEKKVTYPLFLN
jgi:predicted Zn finger-like uncharacterized protein